ncbi:hypothetical protein [Aeromicrobium sp.]|uniref:hypothetical protein n=1 Tax=Aeromicrobium sp. TaxID=1871063 RepID=UPI0030BE361B
MTSLLVEGTAAVRDVRSDPIAARRVVTAAALMLIAVQVVLRGWAVSSGWFFGDDFTFLADAGRGEADLGWLFHRHDFQRMPLGFVLVLLVDLAGPFAWWAAAAELLAFQAAAGLACWWMLRMWFGDRLRILVPLTIYLFSAITVPSLMWWAAGLNSLMVQPFVFLAIGLHVLLLRTRRKRYAIGVTLCLVVALLFFVKALLIVPMLAIITVCYAAEGSVPRRIWSSLVRFRFAWVAYAVPSAIYLAAYFATSPPAPPRGDVDYSGLAERFVVTNLSTALFGGPWRWMSIGGESGPRQLADPPQAAVIGCLLILGGVVVALMMRHRGVLTPLWFVVPYVAFTVGLLAYGRAGVYGRVTSAEVRYWSDFMPFLTLAVGLALMPVRGLPDVLRERSASPFAARTSTTIAGVYLTAFVLGSIVSTVTYVQPWHKDYEARRYLTTARQGLEAGSAPVELADQPVPGTVVPALIFPYNLPSRVLSPIRQTFTTPDIATDLAILDETGAVVPGVATPDIAVSPRELARCLVGGGGTQQIELGSATFDFPFWLSMTYRSDTSDDIGVTVGTTRYEGRVESGSHILSLRTTGSIDRVTLDLPAGARVCVEALHVGAKMEPR